MKAIVRSTALSLFLLGGVLSAADPKPLAFAEASAKTFENHHGGFVLVDCGSGAIHSYNPKGICEKKLAPCSTFKIWNTLIGLETGILTAADQNFYRWDGKVRFIPEWNQDLTLKQAFQFSCVPAYQDLARKIGKERMQEWIDKIGYGDRNISAGLDVFWLPETGRKTLLLSATEQAQLMARLAAWDLPFAGKSQPILREIMLVKKTERGVLYGKTGSGLDDQGKSDLGWFVGYVESGGKVYAFASLLMETDAKGKDARAAAETIFAELGLL